MKLVPIDNSPDAPRVLFDLLSERKEHQNISHKRMPTFQEHVSFVRDHPYQSWSLIEHEGEYIGAVYLTKRDEIGVSIFERHTGKGYGRQAVEALMNMHGKRRYLANVAPLNEHSKKMWEKMGFKHIQETYECP